MSIHPTDLPPSALLRKYVDEGAYTDCYATELPKAVTHPQYVEAFYTTAVFKLERLILRWLVAKPSTDADARRLACAETSSFAAWSVEDRTPDQVLMCDYLRRTRSWLMVAPSQTGIGTRLYFGSAVVPVRTKSGPPTLGFRFNALLGFHKLYSRVLLSAARSRLLGAP
jgi:hypothetical protein